MGTSSFICGLLSLTFLAIFFTAQPANSLTMDEIIAGASNSIEAFDFLGDLSGGTVRQELDMILTIEQYRELQGLSSADDPSESSRQKRKAIKHDGYRWTNKEIPYKVASGVFSTVDMNEINKAIEEWQTYTCIRFRNAGFRDNDFVQFQDGSGCSSYVGMSGGHHPIALAGGCRVKGVIAHEIGHAVGFFHEQNRPDRDEYIIIQKQNIADSRLYHNFDKYPYSSVSTYDVPYDYRSIMHYGGRAFTGNGQLTIKTIDPAYQDIIGNRDGLSFRDIKLANLMYSCNEQCDTSISCPGEGFVGKDCKCWCPGNPVQECDGQGVTLRPTTKSTDRPTPKSTAAPCEDMNRYCDAWAKGGYCETNTYVRSYCKSSCNLCNSVSVVTEKTCSDQREHCGYWKESGFCTGVYQRFMSEYCPKTCGLCGTDNINIDSRRTDSEGEGQGGDNGVGFVSSSLVLISVSVLSSLRHFM